MIQGFTIFVTLWLLELHLRSSLEHGFQLSLMVLLVYLQTSMMTSILYGIILRVLHPVARTGQLSGLGKEVLIRGQKGLKGRRSITPRSLGMSKTRTLKSF